MIRRKLVCFVVLSVATVFLSSCEEPVDERYVVAKVEDESLTIQELIAEIPPQIRSRLSTVEIREYVLRWINSQALYHEALEQKLDEGQGFQREFEKLKRELLITKLVEKTLNEDVTVTDAEIKAYFEVNKEGFRLIDDQVHAYHVLLGTRKEANAVSKRLKAGEAFAAVFRDVNLDSSSHNGGWDLGYFSKNEIAPEISRAVFKLRKGATSLPIKSAFGYHVLQLVNKQKKGDIKNFELVKEEIRLKIQARKKQDKYERFLLQMKSKHPYETNFQLLGSSVLDSLLETSTRIGH